MTMGTISYTYDHQWYVDVADAASGAPKYVLVTDDEGFNPSNNDASYEPKYKCNKTNPKYVTGRKTNIEMDIDIVEGQELQE